jgi:hypothetical protein
VFKLMAAVPVVQLHISVHQAACLYRCLHWCLVMYRPHGATIEPQGVRQHACVAVQGVQVWPLALGWWVACPDSELAVGS